MPSVRAGGASFGRLGRPAIARVVSASEELPTNIVAQGRGESSGAVRNGWEPSAPVRRGALTRARPNRFSRSDVREAEQVAR